MRSRLLRLCTYARCILVLKSWQLPGRSTARCRGRWCFGEGRGSSRIISFKRSADSLRLCKLRFVQEVPEKDQPPPPFFASLASVGSNGFGLMVPALQITLLSFDRPGKQIAEASDISPGSMACKPEIHSRLEWSKEIRSWSGRLSTQEMLKGFLVMNFFCQTWSKSSSTMRRQVEESFSQYLATEDTSETGLSYFHFTRRATQVPLPRGQRDKRCMFLSWLQLNTK